MLRGGGREQGDEIESKSISSDGAGSADEQEVQRKGRKRYHRHTQRQIQEMERLFKECPHPDEKARLELSRELNLDPRQVKFWFQNKRTQMKAHQERHDNSYLRSQNDKLKAENAALQSTIRSVLCSNCGGPTSMHDESSEDHQLRLENAKLKEEVARLAILAKRPSASPVPTTSTLTVPAPLTASSPPTSSTELGLNNIQEPTSLSELAAAGPSVSEIASRPLCLTDAEKVSIVELAVSAMEELAQVAQAGEPLWVLDPTSNVEVLDNHEYLQRFPSVIGPTPFGLKFEATRETDLVMMDAPTLIETLMDVVRWTEMFPCIIAKARTVEVLSNGTGDTFDGAMHLIYAELQLPSPLVPAREIYFLRYSKQVDHLWVVVDVSLDSLRGNPPPSLLRCRKRPSGCVIEETSNGYSKVTWVEHVEVDDAGVHPSYQELVDSGLAFGAQRWVTTLQRQCERIASLLSNTSSITGSHSVLQSPEGRRSLLKLAERMTNNFCGGVSASVNHMWITLSGMDGPSDDCHVVIRKSVDDPGRPPVIFLSAATSLWLPVSPDRIFQFLRDERYRAEWDILSNMGIVEEILHIPKGQDPGNSVSLLKVNAVNSNQSNMLILQDCCTDKSCSLVIYAPVDVAAMGAVLKGGDPDIVLLLPSGFAILPDGNTTNSSSERTSLFDNKVADKACPTTTAASGCLLTVAFQILVDHVPSAKLSLESVATVNNLISSTVCRIKSVVVKE